ncbi:MAG: carboxypeptidase regulatory-like domain-containing protein [Blastocatellales bacterium]
MRRQWLITVSLLFAFSLVSLNIASSQSQPGTITGTVKDPNGAVVADARVTVRNEATGATRDAATDSQGRFKVEGLASGGYNITIKRDGFKTAERAVAIESGKTATVEIKLEIAETRAEVTVATKGSITPNSDPNYRALRDGDFAETYEVTGLTLKRDVGAITLRSGRVSFLPPVLGRQAIGVFTGDGEFTLTPLLNLEKNYLKLVTEKDTVVEQFDRLVFCFTDDTWQAIKSAGKASAADPQVRDTLRDFRNRMRRNTETPRSFIEALHSGENVENVEAAMLGYLYNPKRAPFFSAYIFGKKHGDLRFHIRPHGAMPQMLSPEEVALINYDVQGKEEGVWYLSHLESEWKAGTASSSEDKRVIDAEHYRIETVISGEKLTATCELTFTALADGERVFGFGLLPTLRATKVVFSEKEIDFIQEKKNDDSAFHAILPEPLVKGRKYKIYIEYQGNKVVEDEGGGNFAVGARTSWYPSVNAFNDRATFDLTFKVPKQYVLVGVGKQVKEGKEGDFAVSQWVSEIPLAVAGFNYGKFKKQAINDEQAKYQIEGYATSTLPDWLRGAESIGGMSPTRLTEKALVESQNSIRIYNHWFGEAPYGRIAITQQPEPNFGQSWPTLVYLPIISFFDSTQRWQMFGMNSRLTEFIQEVTAHEVAHQWWGHVVGWSSYHDQWLSEGFADFSAGLYLQYTEGGKLDKYLKFWEKHRRDILEKNQFGFRPNDVGPIWMGLRLNTPKAPRAYSQLVYPKGSYVLHMLRWMMHDRQTRDQRFIAMMRDFVKSHFNDNASTESFKAIVEKHMTPQMDLDGNKRMDWFFSQWVYGTEVPRYKFDYTLTPEADGKVTLKGALTQSGVSPNFKMPVPIYLDFDGKNIIRLGTVNVVGNMTTPEFPVKLPQKPKRVLINYHHDVLAHESVSVGK